MTNPCCDLAEIKAAEKRWLKEGIDPKAVKEVIDFMLKERESFLAKLKEADRRREAWLKANPPRNTVLAVIDGLAQWVDVPA